MKKTYETPTIEKVAFQYRDQVVVASGNFYGRYGVSSCENEVQASTTGTTCEG